MRCLKRWSRLCIGFVQCHSSAYKCFRLLVILQAINESSLIISDAVIPHSEQCLQSLKFFFHILSAINQHHYLASSRHVFVRSWWWVLPFVWGMFHPIHTAWIPVSPVNNSRADETDVNQALVAPEGEENRGFCSLPHNVRCAGYLHSCSGCSLCYCKAVTSTEVNDFEKHCSDVSALQWR